VRSSTFFDHPPLAMPVDVQGYNIEFDQSEGQATLTLVGDLGRAAPMRCAACWVASRNGPGVLHVDPVAFRADLDAFDPLLELARERWRQHQPGVVLDSLSETVRESVRCLGRTDGATSRT